MKFKKIILIFFLLAAAFLGYFFRSDLTSFSNGLFEKIFQWQENSTELIGEIRKQISLPTPLRGLVENTSSSLTESGVLSWTNEQRARFGLPPLAENSKLNQAALLKAQDMLEKQYFEHISPSGAGPGDLAEKVGYDFIAIGENLATGNYQDDQALVQAWMDSPGHRANILNTKYTEIGVAVVRGTFEGHATWMAVQEFGLPLSFCPPVDSALKNQVESQEAELRALQQKIENARAELKNIRNRDRELYNQKAAAFNELIETYNGLAKQFEAARKTYNAQAQNFNDCINSVGANEGS